MELPELGQQQRHPRDGADSQRNAQEPALEPGGAPAAARRGGGGWPGRRRRRGRHDESSRAGGADWSAAAGSGRLLPDARAARPCRAVRRWPRCGSDPRAGRVRSGTPALPAVAAACACSNARRPMPASARRQDRAQRPTPARAPRTGPTGRPAGSPARPARRCRLVAAVAGERPGCRLPPRRIRSPQNSPAHAREQDSGNDRQPAPPGAADPARTGRRAGPDCRGNDQDHRQERLRERMDGHVVLGDDGTRHGEHQQPRHADGEEDERRRQQRERPPAARQRHRQHARQVDRDERREDALLGHQERAVRRAQQLAPTRSPWCPPPPAARRRPAPPSYPGC